MKEDWQQDELVAEWTLLPEELLMTKTGTVKLFEEDARQAHGL